MRAFLQDLNLKSAEYERIRQKNERILNEKFAETDRRFKETERYIKDISKNINGISNSNGEYAEDFFINCFSNHSYFAQQEFDIVTSNLHQRNKKLHLECEFDLVLYNGSSVVIIEIKYKARKDDIESLLEKPEIFKRFYPEYRNYKFYLGLAGFTVEKEAEAEAKKQGIAVIKQVGETMVVNDENLRVF